MLAKIVNNNDLQPTVELSKTDMYTISLIIYILIKVTVK